MKHVVYGYAFSFAVAVVCGSILYASFIMSSKMQFDFGYHQALSRSVRLHDSEDETLGFFTDVLLENGIDADSKITGFLQYPNLLKVKSQFEVNDITFTYERMMVEDLNE